MVSKVSDEAGTKREAILRAARTLFAKQSYEETTIADIAREAGIAVGTVYLYFRNKREIYTAVALNMEALIADAFRNPELLNLPFEQVLRVLVDEIFRISREHKSLMALLQIDMQSSEEVKQHEHSDQQINAALEAILRHAIEKGELAPFNTEFYAQMILHMGEGILHQCFGVEKGEREEIYHTCLLEFIERLCFGPSLREGYKD
jgi:TetR/AcrR family fatty acid metabolism transcriptional regulator